MRPYGHGTRGERESDPYIFVRADLTGQLCEYDSY